MQKLYKKAGVDVAKADDLVNALRAVTDSTVTPGVIGGIGKFAAVFDPRKSGYKDPLLLSATDGIGTKILLAEQTELWDGVGKDLVAMCVNDLVTHGAAPWFFLDYFATAALDEQKALRIIKGIAAACVEVGCALVGGETAEMPGVYPKGGCDLVGFAVGAVERGEYIDGGDIRSGDIALGLEASGAHANGFSLLRELIVGVDLDQPPPFDSPHKTLAGALMAPTTLYVKPCLNAAKSGGVRGFAHITGGGLADNLGRIIPDRLCARLRLPPLEGLFAWLRQLAKADDGQLRAVFNCGIGMVAVVAADAVTRVTATLEAGGQGVVTLGEITVGDERVEFV